MDPIGGQQREKSNKSISTKKRRNKKMKKRTSLQGGGNSRLSVSYLSKFKLMRFFYLREMLILRRGKSKKEQQEREGLVKNIARMKEQEGRISTCFWRDPDAKFCIICGDDQERHLELKCPYNYLSPDAYVPCRARYALWGNYTTTLRYKCLRHKEEEQRDPPMHDETNSRRLGFLRCLVRVNNLPERCHPEQLAMLFSQFGPLRMWHVAMCRSGACKGYGCVIFHHCEHADEAIEVLNCYEFGERKLRVDWAYPCLNKLWKMPPLLEVPKYRFGTFKFSIMAYPRSSDQFNCYICGLEGHLEHFCPYNYIFGRFNHYSCRGECTPGSGQHRITSLAHGKFLRHVVRVSNMPPGFKVLCFQELFSPFGPMPMWDVPMFKNYICGCNPQIRMRFGVVVFKNRSDGERAINYLNGYEAGGCKLRVDWAYPSV